ncbi:isoleucine--tRNA ligase [Candidatus Finniella inopinata]|uniref:Isoleucine--tRNA ligase n=2 Tax=Candidatus Finniella inopinata TaxID=1696036 RepID=A0A4V2DZP4_9PROT|nr:isoleucine--tRNA ligase [Candidatus Finniella inopinata]
MDYKNTVFLPKTSFSMKASLAQREPEILQFWQSIDLYGRLRAKAAGRKKFILHFGPPYANGHIHIGHALSEVLKDIVTKTYQMMGYDAPLVPGWDCHGLPIEWKIEENYRAKGLSKDEIPVLDFLKECRSFAEKWMNTQKSELERLGILADWQQPYSTMTPSTEGKIAEKLLQFSMKGLLYRGLKPVLWSVVEKTALAEAEVEYKDHTSDAVFVKFDVVKSPLSSLVDAALVIWTTTPWTLPGNRAIAYGPDFDYAVIQVLTATDLIANGQRLVLAKDLVPQFCQTVGLADYKIAETFKGEQLQGTVCAHPFQDQGYDFAVPALPGDHVTVETGTGLVHTAPGHGVEDFMVGKAFDLEVPATVQADGTYYAHVPLFAGQHIYKVAPKMLEALKDAGALLHATKLLHSYPHSWRSKTPLIYRATSQWFLNVDAIRQQALKEIDRIEWFPAQGRNRIRSMVENRPDWCLSRQRTWGVPIPLFVHKQSGEPLKDDHVNARIVKAIGEQGIEAWHTLEDAHFLGADHNPNDFEKVTDIVDVWFDSACTQDFVLKHHPELAWPADVYFEGSDQHRGWFQSSLMASVGLTDKAPYRQVVTHGFVLDEKGYKMSKSTGNVVGPDQVINTLGADLLRLWIVGSDYTQDLRIGSEILKHQEDIYRRFRNTLRYLLGALADYTTEEQVTTNQLPDLEKWVLHQLTKLHQLHADCVKEYDFSTFYTALHTFCSVDLSAFYFDIRKDSLYCDAPTSAKRRAARTVMNHVFLALTHWLAPVLSFTAEEAWQAHSLSPKENQVSIHEREFLTPEADWYQPALAEKWQVIRDVRRVITNALELERSAKTIGSSLQAHVAVYVSSEIALLLNGVDLAELAITSAATMVIAQSPGGAITLDDVPDVGVIVNSANGHKCDRCWRVLPEVNEEVTSAGDERSHQDVCYRCEDVLVGQG